GDDDLLHRAAQVGLSLLTLGEQAGGLHDDVGADTGPIELRRILYLENLDGPAVHRNGVIGMRDLERQIAQDRVVFQQVRQRLGVGDVVYRDELDVLIVYRRPDDVPADASESIDPNLDGH